MNKHRGALLALPTVIALTLGGVALATPALADTAPSITPVGGTDDPQVAGPTTDGQQGTGAAAPVPGEDVDLVAPTPATGEDADVVAPTPVPGEDADAVAPTPVPDEDADPVAPAAPEEVLVVEAPQADPVTTDVAGAAALDVTAPVEGEVLPRRGVVVRGTAVGAASVVVDTPSGGSLETVAADGSFSSEVWFESGTRGATITVTARDASGATLQEVTRTVLVDVPAMPAPTLSIPRDGSVVVGEPGRWDGAPHVLAFAVGGTGVPGARVYPKFSPLGDTPPFGYGGDDVRVAADGTWHHVLFVPAGRYLLTVGQVLVDASPQQFAVSDDSPLASAVVTVAAPAEALAPDAGAAPDRGGEASATGGDSVELLPAAAPRRPEAPSLAHTGAGEHQGDALLGGLFLLGLGAVAAVTGRRRASGGRRPGTRG